MTQTIALIFVGIFSIILFNTIPLSDRLKKLILLALSIYFLYYLLQSKALFFMLILWVSIVYFLNRSPQLNLIKLYIFLIISVFILLKFDLFAIADKNSLLEVAVPTGFSFIMFHSIALLLDRSKKRIKESVPAIDYFSSALYFPTLPIGPFHKFQLFNSSFAELFSFGRAFHGYSLFCFGLFKYSISSYLLNPFLLKRIPIEQDASIHPFNMLLLASIYLYANFSGLSDMIVGISKMIGINIPLNFRFPFFSFSMAEYWRKWHITLGLWFKEYVFTPLNYFIASRWREKFKPDTVAKICVFITFLLIGLWHQFSMKILIYSLLNAILVAFLSPNASSSKIRRSLQYSSTFVAILFINGLFLSENIDDFYFLVSQLFDSIPADFFVKNIYLTGGSILLLIIFYFVEKSIDWLESSLASSDRFVFILNFMICFLCLFFAMTIGIGGTDAVYVGY